MTQEMTISPRRRFSDLYKDLAHCKWMIYNLVKESVLKPFAETHLSLLWVLLRPVIIVGVMLLIKKRSGAQFGVELPYTLYLYSGIVVWWFFSDGVMAASRGLLTYRSLIQKIYFPRLIAILVPVVSNFVQLLIQLCGTVMLIFYFDLASNPKLIFLPVVYLNVFILAFSFGLIFSILILKIRDFEKALNYLLYVGFFVSPVLYSVQMIPEKYQSLYLYLNPIAPSLEFIRQCLNPSAELAPELLLAMFFLTILSLGVGLIFFNKYHEELLERL